MKNILTKKMRSHKAIPCTSMPQALQLWQSKKIGAALIIMGTLAASNASLAAIYEIDPTHANVRFAIDHFNTSTNTGGFYNLEGEVMYSPKHKQGRVSVVIPMASINTGNHKFDEHLKGDDFFNIDDYPTARFESTTWHFNDNYVAFSFRDNDDEDFDELNEPEDTNFMNKADSKLPITHIDGELTLLGQTHPVSLKATKFNCYFSPVVKKQVCGGDFTTTIDRTKWGIDKYVLMGMTKDVTLNIQIEAIRQ